MQCTRCVQMDAKTKTKMNGHVTRISPDRLPIARYNKPHSRRPPRRPLKYGHILEPPPHRSNRINKAIVCMVNKQTNGLFKGKDTLLTIFSIIFRKLSLICFTASYFILTWLLCFFSKQLLVGTVSSFLYIMLYCHGLYILHSKFFHIKNALHVCL